jgi:FkbM family methyltransferase
MSLITGAAQIARALHMGEWPLVGPAIRGGGHALNEWLNRDGVSALVDGEVKLKLSPRAFSGGAYGFDPRLVAELKQVAAPGRDFVDAGAHMGIASLIYAHFAGPEARIVAFEPNPNAFPLLVENSYVNGMRLECFRLALGAEVGNADFYFDGTNPNASLSREAPGKYWYWEDRKKPELCAAPVAVTTIDLFCAALGLQPGVIKLDVEGAEFQVLLGARQTIQSLRPAILLETHVFAWDSFGYDRETLEALIAEYDYKICDSEGRMHLAPLGNGPERDNNHFLLLPK